MKMKKIKLIEGSITICGYPFGYGISIDKTTVTNIIFQLLTIGVLMLIFWDCDCRTLISGVAVSVAWFYLELEASFQYQYDSNHIFDFLEFGMAVLFSYANYLLF